MKQNFKSLFLTICILVLTQSLYAQTAVEHMNFMSEHSVKIMSDMMSYTSAVAHGKSARKVENRRKELLQTVNEAIKKVSALAPYKGDKSLRDSTVKYLKIVNIVLKEDYDKIINMEEVAEQSYDAMEAYLLAQDMADEKLNEAGYNLEETERQFAKTNNVNLIEGSSKLSEKLKKATEVNNYHREVYLIFFKSFKQEAYLIDALNKKDVNAIEQNKNSLVSTSTEGLNKLKTIKAYSGDNSLVEACGQALRFYQKECKENIATLSNFYIKEENFNKVKKSFDAKPQSSRTQADVDQFNKSVNELNKASADYNNTNNMLSNNRNNVTEGWNKASANFLDKHTPKYK